MVSIYILVWLRTWAYGKGSDNILQARKVWTSVGGAIRGVRRGSKETFWEMVVTDGGSQKASPVSFGGLSMGNVSRWMDEQGETVNYGGLVCV